MNPINVLFCFKKQKHFSVGGARKEAERKIYFDVIQVSVEAVESPKKVSIEKINKALKWVL